MKNYAEFAGIFPALLTPYTEDDKINEKALEALIEYLVSAGVTGFYVGGSTGEAFLLSEPEREGLYKTVADIVNGRAKLIAHVGDVSLKKAQKYAVAAEKAGFDAVSAVTPFYYKFSETEIESYYKGIVDAVSLPMFIYYIPLYTGAAPGNDMLSRLLSDERFAGIKFTSGDFYKLTTLKRLFPDKVILNGFDEMFLSGLAAGATGGIGSTYNLCPKLFIKIRDLFLENRIPEAQILQRDAAQIVDTLLELEVMPATKAAVSLRLGTDFGPCRAPFRKLGADDINKIKTRIMPIVEKYKEV